jgi:quercetin dioxygenase-like cupin family protein
MAWRAARPTCARPLSASFRARAIRLAAGHEHRYDSSDWNDALVIVRQGSLELETSRGVRLTYRAGSVLCLANLPLQVLRNPGTLQTVLLAISRRR